MASIILKSAASAVGGSLVPGFGAFFGVLGGAVGGMVDQSLGLGAHVTGPRLDSLTVQDSRYGAGVPFVYGSARVAGNVIWSTDLIETTHNTSVGGKGGGFGSSVSETTYTYSVHCAIGIAQGPVGGITTIWADSNVIYQDGVWVSGLIDGATIYTGAAGQAPDAFMESILGTGQVPSYKNLSYIAFENLQLAGFGNRLPNLTFEISPGMATSNPSWLGSADAALSQRQTALQCGAMLPITLTGSGNVTDSVLVGGYVTTGSNSVFEVASYDVSENTPAQLSRLSSASFATGTGVADCSWALAPDERFIAMYLSYGPISAQQFVIYDTEGQVFGTPIAGTVGGTTAWRQVAWIDAQHFVIDDTTGGARGLHVFARAGLDIIDLGYWDVWGAGNATTRLPLLYAQFTPSAGGLMNYMTNTAFVTSPATLYAVQVNWNDNALSIGTPMVVASGLTPTIAAGGPACLIETGDGEWTLNYSTVSTIQLISFEPSPTSITITRPWQTLTPTFGTSATQFPVFYGDRLVYLQSAEGTDQYVLSEIMLQAGSFTLTVDGVAVANGPSATLACAAIALDPARMLVMGNGGFVWDILQFAIVQRCPTGSGLDAIMGDLLTRAGYESGDYDVSALADVSVGGYVMSEPMSARSAIQPLQVFSVFDLIETSGELKAVPRHSTADVAIAASEWRAVTYNQTPPPALDITRAQELDLPREIDIDYIDPARNYEVNSQRARRIAGAAVSVQKINLPIVTDADTAKSIAETRLFALWAERDLIKISISRAWLAADVGDVVDLGNGTSLRISSIQQNGGLLQIEGFYVNASTTDNSAANADTGLAAPRALPSPAPPSFLYLLDTPLLQNTDDQPGVYAAVTGLPGWDGASLWRAPDGVNYTQIASLPQACIAGITATTLGNGNGCYPDNANSVNVQVINGELSSCGTADLYNGANAALLGTEIIQFQTATLIGPGLYTLTNLLRGRRGTEDQTGTHATGETFVMLQSGPVQFLPALLTDRGATYEFRCLSANQTLGEVVDDDFTYGLGAIAPFFPANITGSRASGTGSDLTLKWIRRARLNAEWVDYIDVPLDEPVELYNINIMNGTNVMRTFSSVGTASVTYTAAEQSADWGTVPSSFAITVSQISSRYGPGKMGSAVV